MSKDEGGPRMKTPTTREERRANWQALNRGGITYSSRWGVKSVGFVMGPNVSPRAASTRAVSAAIVSPDLNRQERAELEKPLRARRKDHPDALNVMTAGMLAFLLTLLALAGLGKALPSGTAWPLPGVSAVVAVVVVPLLAMAVTRWRHRRAAGIPEKFHGRVLTGTWHPGHITREDVVHAATSLGDLENTSGTDDADVDAAWREAWESLTQADERDQAAREADAHWASAPVDDPATAQDESQA